MCDVASTVMIYTLVSWNLFEYCLYFFGFAKDEWIINWETLAFDEDNVSVRNIRFIFFSSVFLFTIPLFLKKSLDDL